MLLVFDCVTIITLSEFCNQMRSIMSIANDPLFFKNIAIMMLSKVYNEQNVKEKMVSVLQVVLEAGESGLTTRDIANKCDLSVYSARNWLIKLETDNVISRIEKVRSTSWHHTSMH